MGLDPDVHARVLDTVAETRFLVLPQRPGDTEGWSQDRLADIVSRESMIGVALDPPPEQLRQERNRDSDLVTVGLLRDPRTVRDRAF